MGQEDADATDGGLRIGRDTRGRYTRRTDRPYVDAACSHVPCTCPSVRPYCMWSCENSAHFHVPGRRLLRAVSLVETCGISHTVLSTSSSSSTAHAHAHEYARARAL